MLKSRFSRALFGLTVAGVLTVGGIAPAFASETATTSDSSTGSSIVADIPTATPYVVGVIQEEDFRDWTTCLKRLHVLQTNYAYILRACDHVGGPFGIFVLQYQLT